MHCGNRSVQDRCRNGRIFRWKPTHCLFCVFSVPFFLIPNLPAIYELERRCNLVSFIKSCLVGLAVLAVLVVLAVLAVLFSSTILQMGCGGLVIGSLLSQKVAALLLLVILGRNGDSFDDGFDGSALEGDFVNDLDEREIVCHVLGCDEFVGILGRDGSLELLTVQKIRLDLVPERATVLVVSCRIGSLALTSKGLGAFAVAASVARSDEIGHAAGFGKGVVPNPIKEHVAELGHFSETHPEEGSLGVSTEAYAVDKAGTESNNVLESTADFGSCDIRDVLNPEVGRGVEELPGHFVCGRPKVAGKGRLTHLALGNFRSDVGAHENTAGEIISHGFGDSSRDENGRSCFFAKVDTLDETDASAGRMGRFSNGGKKSWQELVGKDKDQKGCVLARLGEVRNSLDIVGQLDAGEVLDVLVLFVDDFGELSLVLLALVHWVF
mmetsp:Transcript_4155/g.11909  ORF Transcript_4155/g.11909 Transcript_4155/m.11909 type:complete len:439 (+) Transcript_4155:427-1743(+)